jgi:hypothetical protein
MIPMTMLEYGKRLVQEREQAAERAHRAKDGRPIRRASLVNGNAQVRATRRASHRFLPWSWSWSWSWSRVGSRQTRPRAAGGGVAPEELDSGVDCGRLGHAA